MKRLFLVRHAKTEIIRRDCTDFQRNLKKRGINDSTLIANQLLLKETRPDLIISSTANRAIQTARLFADILKYQQESIIQLEELYDGFTTHEFLAILDRYGKENESIMIFGHNPSIEYLAFNLSMNFYEYVPTLSLIHI